MTRTANITCYADLGVVNTTSLSLSDKPRTKRTAKGLTLRGAQGRHSRHDASDKLRGMMRKEARGYYERAHVRYAASDFEGHGIDMDVYDGCCHEHVDPDDYWAELGRILWEAGHPGEEYPESLAACQCVHCTEQVVYTTQSPGYAWNPRPRTELASYSEQNWLPFAEQIDRTYGDAMSRCDLPGDTDWPEHGTYGRRTPWARDHTYN